MRILWVKAGKLLPVDTGGKIRSYNILRHLHRGHDVTLFSYYGGGKDSEYETQVAHEFPGAQTLSTGAPDGNPLAQSAAYVRRVFDRAPFAVSKFTDPQVKRRLGAWLGQRPGADRIAERGSAGGKRSPGFDVAVCDFLSASMNFPAEPITPVVLFQHNVETALWRRLAASEPNPVKRIAYKIEAGKMAGYERAVLQRFRHVIAVSAHDQRQMLALDPPCEISVVPTGVDTETYNAAPPASADPARIVFIGSMDWEPNIDAATYFCRGILPRILEQCPLAKFRIVGRNPRSRVKQLASDSVEVTGTVPSISGHLREATVVVVPLRIGGGTRLKIFEAMATGRAVVSTSIGAEGLPVESGRDLIVADDAQAFADAVVRLLNDATLRRRYEVSAAQLAAQYDWSHIARQFAEVLERACLSQAIAEQT